MDSKRRGVAIFGIIFFLGLTLALIFSEMPWVALAPGVLLLICVALAVSPEPPEDTDPRAIGGLS